MSEESQVLAYATAGAVLSDVLGQVDQPVCEDCVSRVLLELDQRYKDALQQESA